MKQPWLTTEGRITLSVVALASVVFMAVAVLDFLHSAMQNTARADDVTTSVTVLNTPPQWQVDAQEQTESSTSSPTNSGQTITWTATANDSSDQDYYLLICSASSTPTANAGAAPECGSGTQWAVSNATTDETQATAATTTTESFAERNEWYAYICDADPNLPKCNNANRTGSGNTASPFHVNHRPTFTAFANNSPQDPGTQITWSASSTDSDSVGPADTVQLYICKAQDFTGSACGAGGTWATSSPVAADPNANYTITIPTQDAAYDAYGYIVDNHDHEPASGNQGSQLNYTVDNVAPTVASSSISLNDTDGSGPLTLTTEQGTTSGFTVSFTVSDNNSCQNSGGADEIRYAEPDVYRSGVGQAGCSTEGDFNTNNCYTGAAENMWDYSCSPVGGSCSGASDTTQEWECSFSLWYNADPTDGSTNIDTQFFDQNWLASVEASDDNFATGTPSESATGNELNSFLAFDVATTSIAYGGLEPGNRTDPIDAETDISATGNVGLDENLSGDAAGMCPDFPNCPGAATNTIPVSEQVFATSSVAYADATSLDSAGQELEENVPKTTSTATPAQDFTYWGINVPGTITQSGDYTGQNTILGVKSEATQW
jgi:hypothetical protein